MRGGTDMIIRIEETAAERSEPDAARRVSDGSSPSFTAPALFTYRLLIEYDGTEYHGWQVQPGYPTIQAALEDALSTALRGKIPVTGSGRTDAGVHARGQVAHFHVPTPVEPYRLQASLNGILPPDIVIRAIDRTTAAFHARFDALDRRYHYYLSEAPCAIDRFSRTWIRQPLDFDLMNKTAKSIIGSLDFNAFCRIRSETKNRVCTVTEAVWIQEHIHEWYFRIVADRFLHGMVRALTGTMIEIGRGKRPPDDIRRVLDSRDRREAGPAAPARGLVLEEVRYAG